LSYYTGKVRCYLRYKEVPFEEVLGSADVYEKVIVPKTGVRFVPVLITPSGEAVQDSTDIIDYVERKHPKFGVYPSTPRQRFVALLLEVFADEWLLLPAMHHRWNFLEQRKFVVTEFAKSAFPNVRTEDEIKQLGEQVSTRFAGSLAYLGITAKTTVAIERLYLELLQYLNVHFQHHLYILGNKPCLADFALMGPLYAHLFRDPLPGSIMKIKAPHVAEWVERMNDMLPSRVFLHTITEDGSIVSNATKMKADQQFLPNDEIPETLIPVLKLVCSQQLPVIADTVHLLSKFLEVKSSQEKIPRSIGWHQYNIYDSEEKRLVYPYVVWMFQRPYDWYHSLNDQQRQSLNQLLDKVDDYSRTAKATTRSVDYFAKLSLSKSRVKRVNNLLFPDNSSPLSKL